MPASEMRSSARVAPRSVSRVAATSAMIGVDGLGRRLDAAGAVGVTDGAEAHHGLEDLLARSGRQVLGDAMSMPSRRKTGRRWAK